MSVLRAGVIGMGMMGRNHVRVLSNLDGVELVGIADPQGDRFGIAGRVVVHDTPESLIGAGLDLCVVAVATEDHEPVALALADAGVHALVEKPLADSLAAAQRVAEAFEAAGLVGAVGHIERYNPALRALRDRLEEGLLGEVYQISTRRQGPFPARVKDVGVVKDLATHDVDLTAFVSGSAYSSISARTAHKTGRPHEDLVAATGALVNGTVTNHLVNWLSPAKERVTVVLGERGALVADTLTADLTFHANGTQATQWDAIGAFRGVAEGDVTRFAIPKPEPLRSELEAFRDAVDGDARYLVSMREGLEAIRVAEAVLEAARTQQSVRIKR
jgi:predicted dehydrogenase